MTSSRASSQGSGRTGGVEARTGTLTVAGAPIGTPRDASPRLRAALESADLVAAEDTRRLRRLARDLGVTVGGRVLSYYDANERRRSDELLAALGDGRDVLLVSDAGMPGISDPGYRLVSAAAATGVEVTVLPGPSAVTAALAVSGLPSDRFCFEGFLPRRPGERRSRLAELSGETRTMVFFEARHRLVAALAAMAEAFGPQRPAVACRELTKTYEEVRRGTLAELTDWATAGVLGEVTLVVAGWTPDTSRDAEPADLAAEVARREADGVPRKAAILETARGYGLPKRAVYDAVVAARRDRGG